MKITVRIVDDDTSAGSESFRSLTENQNTVVPLATSRYHKSLKIVHQDGPDMMHKSLMRFYREC